MMISDGGLTVFAFAFAWMERAGHSQRSIAGE